MFVGNLRWILVDWLRRKWGFRVLAGIFFLLYLIALDWLVVVGREAFCLSVSCSPPDLPARILAKKMLALVATDAATAITFF